MNPSESFDPHSLASLDERSLERLRYELVVSCDDRRDLVIDELLRRGTAVISARAAREGQGKGLSAQQIGSASEEAAVTLMMRLRVPTHLTTITALARTLAAEAVAARAPEPDLPAQMVWRPPPLREVREDNTAADVPPQRPPTPAAIDAHVRDAARRGRITPNDWRSS